MCVYMCVCVCLRIHIYIYICRPSRWACGLIRKIDSFAGSNPAKGMDVLLCICCCVGGGLGAELVRTSGVSYRVNI